MINTIKQEYHKLPRRQQREIYWGMKLLFTELSKILVLTVFFLYFGKGLEFLFTALSLFPLRTKMGGLHFKTYWGCLFVSILLFANAILIMPTIIPITKYVTLILLIASMVFNLITKPVINPTRPPLTEEHITKSRRRIGVFFAVYIIAAYIFYNDLFVCGTWIIVEQTLQLLIATLKERGVLLWHTSQQKL